MSKFTYDVFYGDTYINSGVAFNKSKYKNKNEMLDIASRELDISRDRLTVSDNNWYVWYGYGLNWDNEEPKKISDLIERYEREHCINNGTDN